MAASVIWSDAQISGAYTAGGTFYFSIPQSPTAPQVQPGDLLLVFLTQEPVDQTRTFSNNGGENNQFGFLGSGFAESGQVSLYRYMNAVDDNSGSQLDYAFESNQNSDNLVAIGVLIRGAIRNMEDAEPFNGSDGKPWTLSDVQFGDPGVGFPYTGFDSNNIPGDVNFYDDAGVHIVAISTGPSGPVIFSDVAGATELERVELDTVGMIVFSHTAVAPETPIPSITGDVPNTTFIVLFAVPVQEEPSGGGGGGSVVIPVARW